MTHRWKLYFILVLGLVLTPALRGIASVGEPSGGETQYLAQSAAPEQPQRRGGSTIPPRGDTNALIPYIISPRDTLLLTDKPVLRWNASPGATSYLVSVKTDKGELIWETQVEATEVVYPGELPLKSGVNYLVTVSADNDRSSEEEEEDVSELQFRLLDETERLPVQTEIAQLETQGLAGTEKALALAKVYIKHNLKAEAIDTLEELGAGGTQQAEVYRWLGEQYMGIGLLLKAESSLLKAVELGAASSAQEQQAIVKAKLGEISAELGKNQEAVRWLTEAHNSYKAMGNMERARELEEQLKSINL
ncbi:hypothetical protein [Microcoleus sp. FACHB-68]|uniref:tetratricopeptide repeat protein n=1 Tax=Microcoleus sp. FACHB-68 TaxID=2692826 RepID=UPI001683185E|nr:hypothetical protein [Microcoleus sp. FACHB-68]MBD1937078.1 hypothetical protein [Microcoleus sp. FACHB-68]